MIKLVAVASLLAGVLAKDLSISLDTTWKPYPLALALLEGVKNQNSSAYFPLLNELSALLEDKPQVTDEQTFTWFLDLNSERQFCSSECLALLNAELASNHFAASIEAQYNLFESVVHGDANLQSCKNVLVFGSSSYCDPTDVFTLQSTNTDNEPMANDHTYSECDNCPNAILYADILSPDFQVFHRNLMLSAENGKLRYTLRYKPSPALIGVDSPKLAGFGATLQLKRTDYLVLDDRSSSTNKFDSSNLKLNTTQALTSDDKMKFPIKAIGHILSQENQFEALYNVSVSLPSYIHEINELRHSAKVKKASTHDRKLHTYPAGVNYVFLNGALTVSESAASMHKLLEDLDKEMVDVEALKTFGFSNGEIRELLVETIAGAASAQDKRPRYEIDETSIVWINDLERDRSYAKWASEPSALLNSERPEALAQVRSNLYNLVLAMDIDNPQSLQLLGALVQTANRGAPIRIGILPLSLANNNQLLTKAFAYGGTPATYAFLSLLMQGLDAPAAFDKLDFSSFIKDSDVKFHELLETKLRRQMDALRLSEPCVVANGIVRELSSEVIGATLMQFLDEEIKIRETFADSPEPSFDDFKKLIIEGSIRQRNQFLDPISPASQTNVDTSKLYSSLGADFRKLKGGDKPTIWAGVDILSSEGQQMMLEEAKSYDARFFPILDKLTESQKIRALEAFASLLATQPSIDASLISSYSNYIHGKAELDSVVEIDQSHLQEYERFYKDLKLENGQYTYILDGVVYSPSQPFTSQELTTLASKSYIRNSKAGALVASKGFSEAASEVLYSKLGIWNNKAYRNDMSSLFGAKNSITIEADAPFSVTALIDPSSEKSQDVVSLLKFLKETGLAQIQIVFNPTVITAEEFKPNRYFADSYAAKPQFDSSGRLSTDNVVFRDLRDNVIHVVGLAEPPAWITVQKKSSYDLDNLVTSADDHEQTIDVSYELKALLIEGFTFDRLQQTKNKGVQLQLQPLWSDKGVKDTSVMENLGYFQLQAQPGPHKISLQNEFAKTHQFEDNGELSSEVPILVNGLLGEKFGASIVSKKPESGLHNFFGRITSQLKGTAKPESKQADINIFTVASGHLYERFLSIMMLSVMKSTTHTVKFWLIEKYLSPSFKEFLPLLAEKLNCEYELVDYKWPMWLTGQSEKQREIWGYKILFLDVLFPQALKNVLFVDSDQIVRTDLIDLTQMDLEGAPYAYTPMGDDRPETEGFRFWKKGYWQKKLQGKPYHISALYKVDLERFKELSAGNILRQHYQQLSRNAGSLSNLDQDLPNDLQSVLPIYSLDDSWLWCETWCSDERLKTAKTIDLCNNPLTKEPKLDRARRQMPEWQVYDDQIAAWRAEQEQDKEQEPVSSNEELLIDVLENDGHDEL